MKNHFLIPVLSILFLSINVVASTKRLDDVVVTATKTAISADESIVPVVVISAEDIEKSSAKDLVSLLSGIAGIDISINGGLGQQSSIFLRGTESRHVLVIIDGVKVGSVSLGTTAFEHIPLNQIQKVEVIKGPRSSLYGSDAVGGVIQVFTKKGNSEQGTIRPQLLFGIGTDKTYKSSVNVSGGDGGFSLSLGANILHSNGYNVMTENNSDKDGYKNSSLLFNVGKLWKNGIELNAMIMEIDAKNEYDNSYYPSSAFHTLQKNSERSLQLMIPVGEKLDITTQMSESTEDQINYQNGAQTSKFESTRSGQNTQFDFYPNEEITLTAGFDNQRDRVEATTTYSNNMIDVDSRFIQGQFDLGMVNILTGYRYDDNSTFGDHDTWNFGLRINPPETPLVITPSIGTAFKAPTINDLYWPADAWSHGNPDLLPETSKTIDLGVAWKSKPVDIALNLYKTKIENLISWQSDAFWIYSPVNIGKATIKGSELTVYVPNRIMNVAVEAAYLKAKDSETNNYLPRRAKKSLKIKLDKSFNSFDMAFELKGYGPSYEDAANQNKISGYAIANAMLAYHMQNNITFTLRGENLFDKDYATAKGGYYDGNTFQTYSYNYNAPGRSFMLEMQVGF